MTVQTRVAEVGTERLDTGYIARIVNGGDELDDTWFSSGPLEALQAIQSDEESERVAQESIPSQLPAADVVDRPTTQRWDGEHIVRHRHHEMFGTPLLALMGRPVFGPVAAASRWFFRACLRVYFGLGAFFGWILDVKTWRAVPRETRELPGDVRSWARARKWAAMRQRARYRLARKRTSWGFTIRRQIAVKASKVAFLGSLLAAMGGMSGVAVLFAVSEARFVWPAIITTIATTFGLIVAGLTFDTVAERADVHRWDLVVAALKERGQAAVKRAVDTVREKPGTNAFWATMTGTDNDLPQPVSPRLHEVEHPEVKLRPAAYEPTPRRTPAIEPVYEAGSWF